MIIERAANKTGALVTRATKDKAATSVSGKLRSVNASPTA
jgi:hypothetical protein